MKEERILVIEKEIANRIICGCSGRNEIECAAEFRIGVSELVRLISLCGSMQRSEELEKNEDILQIIPYCILICGDCIFTYNRSRDMAEERLHGRWSIGLGGHVKIDMDDRRCFIDQLINSVNREFEEEIGLPFLSNINRPSKTLENYTGILYDTTNPVGRVHLGIVFTYCLTHQFSPSHDSEFMLNNTLHRWQKLEDINVFEFESWSQIVLNNL